ncbi:hypothetical protein ASPZODRAFT_133747 [Penicilliopsis zonata CBS 506.65]|uniref:Rhodopsin domain-containing protein n=1 Tax=Penicilliopsis zonata CBS 506.65 TaxID=1073090 RepID=A0A1L9SFJ0_9EURO|nr:hypothetical protein ASPZODRAFT_133747 [Penicilliopsis zonata CBS 506.65]OJJ45873.1 hypothetical protein ASPZODRAFT_133747 [Penicilliopsis zonata CBS 506.65]
MAFDRSLEVRDVAAVFLALASVTTSLRCYVRLRIVKAFGWDDAFMVAALAFFALFSGCMIGGSIYGTGRHLTQLTNHQRTTAMKYWFFCDIGYCISSVLCKISVSIFILRITIHRVHRWVIMTVATLVAIAGIFFFILMLVQCNPISFFWMRLSSDPPATGSCINIDIVIAALYTFSTISAAFDLTIGILPIFLVVNLKMRSDVKIAVAGLLGMACIASVAVFVRIPYVHTLRDTDFLYATTGIAVWSNIETGLGITAGSIATLRPLLRMIRPQTTDPQSRTWPNSRGKQTRSIPLGSVGSQGQGPQLYHGGESNKVFGTSVTMTVHDHEHDREVVPDQEPLFSRINVHHEFHVTTER